MVSKNSKTKNNTNVIGINLLNNFSEKEINGFSHFVACPYFNTDRYVVRLLSVLKRDVLGKRHFDEEMKNKVYEKVFSDKVTIKGLNIEQRKRLSAKLTGLTRLAERFLAVEALEENKVYRNDLVCQKLLEKKQYLLFNRTIRKEEKVLDVQTKRDFVYHKRYYNLSKNVLSHLYQTGQLLQEDNVSEVLYQMDVQSCIEKLKHYITMLSLTNALGRQYDTSSMNITLQLLDLPQYTEHPLLRVYKIVIELMKTGKESVYKKLLSVLESNVTYIPRADLSEFYGILINHCVRQMRSEQFDLRDLFDLYQNIEAKGLLVERNFVDVIKLKTAVNVGCRIGAFDWATEIIEKYKSFINKPIRESVWHYNCGVIAFYQKDYKKALSHFIRAENINADYDINCRVMLLKSFYENDEHYDERTIQKLRSTEKFFKENKNLSSTRKRSYKNFVRILIYIYKFRHLSTKMSLESIKEKLDKQDVNSDRNWLLEKIAEL